MPINVFENGDGIIGYHTDSKRHPGKTDDIDASSENLNEHKCRDHADRNRQADNDYRTHALQKQQQDQDRERSAGINIAFNEGRCRIQVQGLIVDLFHIQALGRQNSKVQFLAGNTEVVTVDSSALTELKQSDLPVFVQVQILARRPHDLFDVCVRGLLSIHGKGIEPHLTHDTVRFLVGDANCCHVTNSHR